MSFGSKSGNPQSESAGGGGTPTQSAKEQAAAAAHLLSHIGQRRTISPPPHVINEISKRGTAHQDFGDTLDAYVAPHWNRAVEQLDGGKGYLALVARVERLERHLEEARALAEAATREPSHLGVILQIVEGAAYRYGHDKSLDSTLSPPSGAAEQAQAPSLWERLGADPYIGRPARFVVDPSKSENLLYRLAKVPAADRTFDAGSTWGEVVETLKDQYNRRVNDQSDLERAKRLFHTVRFRLAIVDSVLTEFDVFDHVPRFEGLEWHLPRYHETTDALRLCHDKSYFLNRLADVLAEKGCTAKEAVACLREVTEAAEVAEPLAYEKGGDGDHRDPDHHVDAIAKALKGVGFNALKVDGRSALPPHIRRPA